MVSHIYISESLVHLVFPCNRVVCKVMGKTAREPRVWSHMGRDSKFHTEYKTNLQKSTLAFKRGETQKTINFGGKLSFILSFLFPERLHYSYIASTAATLYFHCSCLYNDYNYSWFLCIQCWVSKFHTEIYDNFITLQIPLKEEDRVCKEAQRQGDFTDNSNL